MGLEDRMIGSTIVLNTDEVNTNIVKEEELKFSEKFFSFPIRVYDSIQLRRSIMQEDRMDVPSEEPDSKIGWCKIPGAYCYNLSYHDMFTRDLTIDEVRQKGFNATYVFVREIGETFACMWKKEKFEGELDKFMEKYEKWKSAQNQQQVAHLGTMLINQKPNV